MKYTITTPIRLSTFIESQENSEIDELDELESDLVTLCLEKNCASKNDPRPSTSMYSNHKTEMKPKRYSSMPSIGINTNLLSGHQNSYVKGLRYPIVTPLRPRRSPSFSPLDDMFCQRDKHIHTNISTDRASPMLRLAHRFNSNERSFSPSPCPTLLLVTQKYHETRLLRKQSPKSRKKKLLSDLLLKEIPGMRTTSLPSPSRHIRGFATNRTAAATFDPTSISIASISITQGFKVTAETNPSRKQLYANTLGVLANLSKRTNWNTHNHKHKLRRHSSSGNLGISTSGKQSSVWGSRKSRKRVVVSKEGESKVIEDRNDTKDGITEAKLNISSHAYVNHSSDASFSDILSQLANEDAAEIPKSKARSELTDSTAPVVTRVKVARKFIMAVNNEKVGSNRGVADTIVPRDESNPTAHRNVVKAVAVRLWKALAERPALAKPSAQISNMQFTTVDGNFHQRALNSSDCPPARTSQGLQNTKSRQVETAENLGEIDFQFGNELEEHEPTVVLCAPAPITSGSPVRLLEPKHRPSSIYNSFSAFAKTHCLDDSAVAALLYLVNEDQD